MKRYSKEKMSRLYEQWQSSGLSKVALFAGSHQAAEMTAAIYSFMASCKRNGTDEVEWLTDVLERIQSHKHKDLYQLLPNNWVKYRKTQETAS